MKRINGHVLTNDKDGSFKFYERIPRIDNIHEFSIHHADLVIYEYFDKHKDLVRNFIDEIK